MTHNIETAEWLVHMLSNSPAQNGIAYVMNLYYMFGNSGSDVFTDYAIGVYMLTNIGMALSPLKGEGTLAKEGMLSKNVFEVLTSFNDI